jgi:hypothetical protein
MTTIEDREAIIKALRQVRKDAQPGVTGVHVDAPIGATADFAGPIARALTKLKTVRGKLRTEPEPVSTLSSPTLKASGSTKCKFCDQDATGDTDPPTCGDHTQMATEKALIVKSAALQFTFSPLYLPLQKDAHGDWTDPDDLQKAVWGLQRFGDRTINIQHLPGTVAGEWVELATWPWEHEAALSVPGGDIRKAKFPPNTPWMGVVWGNEAWAEVLAGRMRGLSMEGTATRVSAALPGLEA